MELGTVDKGQNVGKIVGQRYSWVICPICKKERWTMFYGQTPPKEKLCRECNGRKNGKVNKKKWCSY